ncbi:MAG: hypothetical protein QXW71_02505, partial [Thermoplasmata archaeon]
MDLLVSERIKKLPTFVKNLVYLSNYIERIKRISPVSVLTYYIYYKYFFDQNIEMSAIIDMLLVYKDIWYPSKKPGYFYLNKNYYLDENEIKDYLKEFNKPGLEDLFYVRYVFEGIFYDILAVFFTLIKDPESIKSLSKDKHLKIYINKLESLGLIKRNEGDIKFVVTKKGWKLQYTIKDLLELIGEQNLFE